MSAPALTERLKHIKVDEASELTGFPREYLREMATSGRIRYKLSGRVFYLQLASLLEFVENPAPCPEPRAEPETNVVPMTSRRTERRV